MHWNFPPLFIYEIAICYDLQRHRYFWSSAELLNPFYLQWLEPELVRYKMCVRNTRSVL